ncbi:NADP-dependent oxidoreductase domain-containing protein 1-like [Dysidea avara]|uniref:NADP-dependent oxidoreductase domain-containing protein 1-like n=1 Tax=Dysidea avara TaxID=196820 RepID=UPI00331E2481
MYVACSIFSVYIISLLNDVLEHAAKQSRAVPVKYVYRVGFIGSGRLGNLIIWCLLHCKILEPHCIFVSTRRPELLKEFSDTGVITCFNNGKVASSCPVLCICCLPSQLSVVAESLQGYLSPSTLVYSIVGGVTLQRHCQLLHTNSILRPSFSWPNIGWTVDSIDNYATQKICHNHCLHWDRNHMGYAIDRYIRNHNIVLTRVYPGTVTTQSFPPC